MAKTALQPAVPTREPGYDFLRGIACMMVVVLHVSAQEWYSTSPQESSWIALHFWNTMTRSAVPLFFMISGALFLRGEKPSPAKLWKKNIPRLFSVWVLWSLFYGLDVMSIPAFLESPLRLIGYALDGYYHLWFLPVMIGVYVLIPVLYAIVQYENGRCLRYFCLIFFCFSILRTSLLSFSDVLPSALTAFAGRFAPDLCGFCGYFIFGYALTRVDISRLRRPLLIAGFGAAWIVTWIIDILFAQRTGAPSAILCGEFSLTTFAEAVSLFLLFRTVSCRPESRAGRVAAFLSSCTLGVYLMHPFFIEHLALSGISVLSFSAWISVPVLSALCLLLSGAISALLTRIPILGKWIA